MSTDSLMGKQIDAFTVHERIGKGGMASVYRAFQPSVNRSVALKVIHLDPNLNDGDEFRSRFALEAQTIAALEHIHILPIYDYGIVNGEIAYIAMRLLRGGSLADLLERGPLDVEHAADIFTQIARGLSYAHSKGVIHRDLKPSNILFDESGNAYLTDFGLAKMVENPLNLTHSGNIVGTPAYMSPEQLRGEPAQFRSDIYSLGCILYHMLVGRSPFEPSEANLVSVIYQHLEKAPTPPRELNPDVTEAVEIVVLRGLEKQPSQRYDSAEMMANALNLALGRKLSTISYPAVKMEQRLVSATRRRGRTFTIAGSIVLLLLTAALVVMALRTVPPSAETTPTITPLAERFASTILAAQTGSAVDAAPSIEEISRARQQLGDSGFIAYITCNQTSQYHAAQAREMSDIAARYGLPFRLYDSNNQRVTQITQVERARADGVRGLIVCPLDIDVLDDTLRSVEEANLPLVLLTSNSPNYGGVLISGDDYQMGLMAGRAAGNMIRDELNGEANVLILGYPDLDMLVVRADGLEDGVREFAPNANIMGRYLGATTENGERSVSQLIADGVDFNVILSINDAGSYGAIAAMEQAGFAPNSVAIFSVDAESLAREYIRDRYFMRASVQVWRAAFSEVSVNALVKLLAGATVPETFLVPPGEILTRADLIQPGGAIRLENR